MAHPGKMLPAIAQQAIKAFTAPGDVVLDPMCGIGTSLVEAVHLGRDAIGIEYEPRWADLANDNIVLANSQGARGYAHATCGDGRDVASLIPPEQIGQVALVITSPPYGPSLHGNIRTTDDGIEKFDTVYSKDKSNLGYASPDDLFSAFGEILANCHAVMRPGGFVVITARPWRVRGQLVDLPGAVLELGASVGFNVHERNVALLCRLTDSGLVGRPSFFQRDYITKQRANDNPISAICHEDVIVLRKNIS